MKKGWLVVALIFWMIFTMILCLSVIGWVLLIPSINDSMLHIPVHPTRTSTWMRIGLDIKDKLLKDA